MSMFWRQIGGHLKKVETCSSGITWGIGYDNTAWLYTSGWGSNTLKGLAFYKTAILYQISEEKYNIFNINFFFHRIRCL